MKLDDGAQVFVDTGKRITKIEKNKNYYIYKGIFPNIRFDTRRRFRK